jgi:hypothetical protein
MGLGQCITARYPPSYPPSHPPSFLLHITRYASRYPTPVKAGWSPLHAALALTVAAFVWTLFNPACCSSTRPSARTLGALVVVLVLVLSTRGRKQSAGAGSGQPRPAPTHTAANGPWVRATGRFPVFGLCLRLASLASFCGQHLAQWLSTFLPSPRVP